MAQSAANPSGSITAAVKLHHSLEPFDKAHVHESTLPGGLLCSECVDGIQAGSAARGDGGCDLGAAFYWTLTYALYRVMRIYNHDEALQYEERMREYAEDDPENREQYEFPEVEKALPECIRSTMKCDDHRAFVRHARRLLREHRRGRFGPWIERLRKIDRLSRIRLPIDARFREDGGYDSIPLPSLVVAFKDHDAIVACFDEECQYMLESSAEPTLGVVFSPKESEEVKNTVRLVRSFVALNVELFEMVEELQKSG